MYFALMGVLHLAMFAVGCLILGALAIRQRGTFLRRVGRLGLFLGLLLIVGSIFNGLWSCLIWGRLYFSTDYVFDFSPFWPITQKVIDAPFGDMRGELFGVSLFQLQLVWLLFAVRHMGGHDFLVSVCLQTTAGQPNAAGNSRRAGQLTGL